MTIKLKKYILSRPPALYILKKLGKFFEKRRRRIFDPLAFRVFNALWLATTYLSFMEEYKKEKKSK